MKKIATWFFSIVFILKCSGSYSQGSWTQRANFPGVGRHFPFSFSIDAKGYTGCGESSSNQLKKDFWEFNPVTDTWTQKADYGGPAMEAGIGFSIGNYGYAGLGISLPNTPDFWQYDPSANSWTQKANFPGGPRYVTVGFSIGNMGYLCTGQGGSTYFNDLWQYNPATDAWIQKASMPTGPRIDAAGFSIGTNGYIISGYTGSVYLSDLWQYNSLTDSWLQKANCPGAARWDAVAISICDKGYFGVGEGSNGFYADWWQYDPALNSWLQKANFPDTALDEPAYFVIGNKGYLGLGGQNNHPAFNYFWEYTPDSICSCSPTANFSSSDTIFCSEPGKCLSFTDRSFCNPTSWHWLFPGATPNNSSQQNPTNICYTTPGTYPVTLIISNTAGRDTLKVSPMITVGGIPSAPILTYSNDTIYCSHASAYQWYLNGNIISGATDSFYVATQGGSYSVRITDSSGCSRLSDGFAVSVQQIQNANHIKIYPNPANDVLWIEGIKTSAEVTVYNVLGKTILTMAFTKQTAINIINIPAGIYFIKITDKIGSYENKFVKE